MRYSAFTNLFSVSLCCVYLMLKYLIVSQALQVVPYRLHGQLGLQKEVQGLVGEHLSVLYHLRQVDCQLFGLGGSSDVFS